MAIKFSDTILSGSLKVSGSYTLPLVDTGSTGVLGQMGINGEVPHFYSSQGWQAVSGSKFTPIPPSGVNIEYLVVAGGGGAAKGGGGAGGYLSSSLSSITSGSTITVTVGAGGTGIVSDTSAGNTANQGGSSSLASSEFSTVAAIGGGGGAIAYYGVGGDGGSGGGGAGLDATGDGDGGSGTAGQGFDGGTGKYTTSHGGLYAMGGGGGASEVGSDAQNTTVNGSAKNGGDGGDGKQSKITGTLTYYAGGGGGGVHGDSTGYVTGDGGQGGGADAADQPGSNGQNAGNAGTANTGGGGGGAASLASYSGQTGGQGGSGVVILAYPTGSFTGLGGIAKSRPDGHAYHTFNSSGTFTLGGSTFNTVLNGENFGILLFSGDNANPRSITGLGFDPGMVWVKNRHSGGENHGMGDILRTTGKIIYPNLTLTETSGEYITPITDGVKITTGNNNYSGNDYVAWCWKAGGSGVSNSNGSITSTVSANQAAGFSIVTYAGNSASSATIGHGLSSAPQLIWIKGRNVTAGWPTMFNDGSYSNYGIRLNESGVDTNNATVFFNNTAPTDTVFSVGGSDEVNDGYNYVAYCFHSVPGYQKVGSYTGTGSAGLEVALGFQARFIMVKKVAPSGDRWLIADTSRGPATNNDEFIDATDSLSERDFNCTNGLTFGSNSFTVNTTDGSFNSSGGTYIYLAIA